MTISRLRKSLGQPETLKFFIVGCGCAFLYTVLVWAFLQAGLNGLFSGALSYLISFLISYFAQQYWTFARQGGSGRAFLRYFTLQVCCLIVASVCTQILSVAGAPKVVAGALPALIVAVFGFAASRAWVFR
ncbi:GtrA family protein [Variibacter gotjawalensis]|uniref:GtrA family protein n=1 Tax=Variibacter gotjawalensis TaxID=1333996 RepID=UPI000BBB376B